jgi:hypothetical protein
MDLLGVREPARNATLKVEDALLSLRMASILRMRRAASLHSVGTHNKDRLRRADLNSSPLPEGQSSPPGLAVLPLSRFLSKRPGTRIFRHDVYHLSRDYFPETLVIKLVVLSMIFLGKLSSSS